MNPIKTTNAMNPAPAKGIESFPTPVIDDVVISEVVNAWKGNYEKLEYGTLWKDVSHAPNQGSFPEHKLVYQQPTSEDGQWVKRIWVNDRVNQDSYNYAIKYSAGSQEHPIYIRTYLVPRETYAPLPDGTPDPLFPTALLVDEEATRAEGELDSKYITVTRVYETLPGPAVPTKRYNERGDLETVIVQTVPPFTTPDKDGLLVTGSQVVQEEMGKGVKTTSKVEKHASLLIKEKKSGLLGETITTDDIVSPSTSPDDLSLNVVASSVEQYTATKSRKRTTFGEPIKLTSKTLIDSPLGLVEGEFINEIVAPIQEPSNISNENLKLIKDSITPIDQAKSEREKIALIKDWPVNYGLNSDELLGYGVRYNETIVKPSEITDTEFKDWKDFDYKDYKPIDQWKLLRREVDREKLSEVLLKYWIRTPIAIDVSLPDKLLDVTVYWGHSYAEGETWTSDLGATTGSYSLSSSGGSKDSYGINGDIYFNIEKGYSGAISGEKHIFFIDIGNDARVAETEILDVLNNFYFYNQRDITSTNSTGTLLLEKQVRYKPWPYIRTRTENIVIVTGSKSKTNNKSENKYASINGFGGGTGEGTSMDVDVSARSINIPPCLHGDITISQENFGDLGNSKEDLRPAYGVRPETLKPTEVIIDGKKQIATSFPAGYYLYKADVELYKYGFVKVTAITVNVDKSYV